MEVIRKMESKIVSVVLTLAICLAMMLGPSAPVVSAQALDAGIEVQPNMTKVGFNEPFSVDIVINNSDGLPLSSEQVYISFTKALIEVVSISTTGTPFTIEPGGAPTFNNSAGTIDQAAGTSPGTNTTALAPFVMTVNMKSKNATGTATIQFQNAAPTRVTKVIHETAGDILNWTQVVNGTVMVGTPTLWVNVTPAGMGDVDITGASIPPSYPNTTTWTWDQNVTLEAVNSTPGWTFNYWSGDIDGPTGASSSYVIMDDFTKNVTANFTEAPPAILADPSSLNFSANVGENPANQTLDICNDGGHILNWTANITGTNVTWLSMSPMNGTNLGAEDCNSTQVAVNTTGMAKGTYHANITITSNPAGPVEVPVTLKLGVPGISASPTSLTFTTSVGVNPPSQTLDVCNSGTGTLNWNATDNAGWLSESPKSGSLDGDECEDVTVSVDVSGMEAGDYTATITITGSDEEKVPVTLHIVSAMPEMPVGPASISASGLSITPQQVQPGRDVTISISVANTGGDTGSYNAVLYINGAVEGSQSVSVPGGTSKNVIFTVSKTKAGVYDVSLAGQSGQFEVVGGGGWFAGGLGTGGIIAIVVVVIVLIVAVIFILRGTARPE
jgi:hypothetical protein